MQIFLKNVNGPTSTYAVDAGTTVSDLTSMVENDVFFTGFRLMANGKTLQVSIRYNDRHIVVIIMMLLLVWIFI